MSKLFEKIASEIGQRGVIGFDRFMELALYCPVYGYYEKETDTVGKHGDFITSVSVGSLFGELLAFQFSEWLETEVQSPKSKVQSRGSWVEGRGGGHSSPTHHPSSIIHHPPSGSHLPSPKFHLIEAGAHRGDLAQDILSWMQRMRPELYSNLAYWIIEPSESRQGWQRKTLRQFDDKVRWATNLNDLNRAATVRERPSLPESPRGPRGLPEPHPIRGIIFCNELLDAMPVRRFAWDAKERVWFEWGVGMQNGRSVWKRMDQCGIEELPVAQKLPDGFTIELSPAAEAWWTEAASLFERGRLVAIDYGLSQDELWIPERRNGTLRAYRQHRWSPDPLNDPGEQDITAHVNFSRIAHAGVKAGMNTDLLVTQEKFLTGIAAKTWEAGVQFGNWGAKEKRQFQTLTHPEHLGRAFRVLVQNKI
ncbi:MAG: hypothetical protein C5B50_01250 [Verrucomicrobia bacterium]|nr:MAG: hypothetical protein C5B50_01250 [Verrucomicrobiota bacterium]